MMKKEHSIKVHSADHITHEAPPTEEAQAKKKKFVEPEISVPADIFKATTFFLFASTEEAGGF
jgi:hypothetical protein